MLFVSLPHPRFLTRHIPSFVGIELRLDLFPTLDLDEIAKAIQTRPTLLTLRRTNLRTEAEREKWIETLLVLKPAYLDLEWDMAPLFLEKMISQYPETKFVLSYHNFETLPEDLEDLYRRMNRYNVFTYKIAAHTRSTNEALQLLLFAKTHPKTSVICMGERGSFGRVLGPIVGNRIDFACLDERSKTAPGQLTLDELVNVYRYQSLNRETAIYGLIGNPIEKSPGHLYHNRAFFEKKLNAVYVKMSLLENELDTFMALAKKIAIRGLSVTIPLKEHVLLFAATEQERIGALNTLAIADEKIRGINTDGSGALDAIEQIQSVKNKKIVILGAGGTARGIAFEAKKRGACLTILNRTLKRAEDLAAELDGKSGSLSEVPSGYDILINTTPNSMPISSNQIRPNTLVLDVIYSPKETPLIKEALLKNCRIVYGEEMYVKQAQRQTAFWISNEKTNSS